MEKLFLLNPYNKNHQKLVVEQNDQSITSQLNTILSTWTNEEYQAMKRKTNTLEEYLVIEETNKVKSIIHIQGEKDRKTAKIQIPSNQKLAKRKYLILATDFAIESLGMLEVFIDVKQEDKELANYLKNNGYESLGQEKNGENIFLKEKESKEIKGRYNESSR